MTLSSALYLLAVLSAANAITIIGYSDINCDITSITVATCNSIANNVCCTFPRGGLQVRGAYFSNLYTATLGAFYQSSATAYCGGPVRDSESGYALGVCLNAGYLSQYFGGGAAWFNCISCSSSADNSRRSLSDEALQTIAANSTCTSTAIPTLFGWEDEGAWALQLQEGPEWDRYNELPVTTDMDTHIENLKAFGAEWYPNARDYLDVAEAVDREG